MPQFLVFFFLLVLSACSLSVWTDGEVPFEPTPAQWSIGYRDRAGDTRRLVYDLGSGDDGIIIRTTKKFGIQGFA
jgi:hypothetical protein